MSTVYMISTNVDSNSNPVIFVYDILSVILAVLETLVFQKFALVLSSLGVLEVWVILDVSDVLGAFVVLGAFDVLVIFHAFEVLESFGVWGDLEANVETDDCLCYCSCYSA